MSNVRSFGTIRKLPSGRFQARYWHLGKQVSADTTFPNKTDARAFLAGIETDLTDLCAWINTDEDPFLVSALATQLSQNGSGQSVDHSPKERSTRSRSAAKIRSTFFSPTAVSRKKSIQSPSW